MVSDQAGSHLGRQLRLLRSHFLTLARPHNLAGSELTRLGSTLSNRTLVGETGSSPPRGGSRGRIRLPQMGAKCVILLNSMEWSSFASIYPAGCLCRKALDVS